MKSVLLSIRPEYVRKILNGTKRYEFRRSIFKDRARDEKIYIYSTAPVKKIVASFCIDEIIEAQPEVLWNQCQSYSGIDKSSFFEYFKDKEKGFAIKIKNLDKFETPVDPKKVIPDFTPPQSFRYVDMDL